MMYPVWEVPFLSGGMIIGLIASFHILPSHLSVSAMWVNIIVEYRSLKEGKAELMDFVSKFTLSILVFAYVFGSLSGVGIWFATTAVSPGAISSLIHNYVWGWATEWVFFIIEVAGIFIYYYTLGRIDRRLHLKIGIIFAIASWITMVIIVGILSFMLTPGKWPETGSFFHGFFNQTYWTQLFLRTGFMFSIAGIFTLIVSSTLKNEENRVYISRLGALFTLLGLVAGAIFLKLYTWSLPDRIVELLNNSSLVSPFMKKMILVPLVLILLYAIFSYFYPLKVNKTASVIAFVLLFVSIFSGERIRESLRKPFLVPGYMYSNQIRVGNFKPKQVEDEVKVMKKNGMLKTIPFVPQRLKDGIDPGEEVLAGRIIALYTCSSCHSLGSKGLRPMGEMIERLEPSDHQEIEEFLDTLGEYPYMPPFPGNATDRAMLAKYLYTFEAGHKRR